MVGDDRSSLEALGYRDLLRRQRFLEEKLERARKFRIHEGPDKILARFKEQLPSTIPFVVGRLITHRRVWRRIETEFYLNARANEDSLNDELQKVSKAIVASPDRAAISLKRRKQLDNQLKVAKEKRRQSELRNAQQNRAQIESMLHVPGRKKNVRGRWVGSLDHSSLQPLFPFRQCANVKGVGYLASNLLFDPLAVLGDHSDAPAAWDLYELAAELKLTTTLGSHCAKCIQREVRKAFKFNPSISRCWMCGDPVDVNFTLEGKCATLFLFGEWSDGRRFVHNGRCRQAAESGQPPDTIVPRPPERRPMTWSNYSPPRSSRFVYGGWDEAEELVDGMFNSRGTHLEGNAYWEMSDSEEGWQD